VATLLAIGYYERLQRRSDQTSVAFFSLNNYNYNYNYNYNHKLNNLNFKYLTYLLGKSGSYDLFKGILTYVLS